MLPTSNLLGQRFGKLTVTGFAGYFASSLGAQLHAYWTCRCDCGNEMIRIKATSLTGGRTKSCGCLKHQKKSKVHLYQKWYHERLRGTLCEEWIRYEIFKEFMEKVGYTNRMRVKKKVRGGVLSPDNFYFN